MGPNCQILINPAKVIFGYGNRIFFQCNFFQQKSSVRKYKLIGTIVDAVGPILGSGTFRAPRRLGAGHLGAAAPKCPAPKSVLQSG